MDHDWLNFWINPPENLSQALKFSPNAEKLLIHLLRAGVISTVNSSESTEGRHLSIAHNNHDVILTKDNELKGDSVPYLEKLYRIVREIELELDSAIYLPSELREDRINSLCGKLDVTREEFSEIVKNWKKPS